MEKIRIEVSGTVQGVGYRPFVYRMAKKTGIEGYVKNTGNSVEIQISGSKKRVEKFIHGLKNNSPPLSKIEELKVSRDGRGRYRGFRIVESDTAGGSDSTLPPDVSICRKCLVDIRREDDRRYMYPFTVCVDCGARYSVIESIPYDRENTSMKNFQMCGHCRDEYRKPEDRRFHAEPTCCPRCGPVYTLYSAAEKMEVEDPVKEAAEQLEKGYLVAIMGIGGTHLASKLDSKVVSRLRERFGRGEKPFAVMARDIEAARDFAHIGDIEEELLESLRRPILVLDRRQNTHPYIAPGLENIGIMLPYTAVHHLIFDNTEEKAFVMTSANLPGEPIFTTPREILDSGFSDYSLVHNRVIVNRVDDSVIRLVDKRPSFIRRSRGYVPEPIRLNRHSDETVMGLGAELNVAACLLKGDRAYLTQYIGDTTRIKTLEYLEESISRLLKLTGTKKIDRIAIDLHPGYATRSLGRKLSEENNAPLIEIQHHFAHTSSIMAESQIEDVVCLALDGAGYGIDGSVWGGEVVLSKNGRMVRFASLEPQLMPGGDLSAYYPSRMLAGILYPYIAGDDLSSLLKKYAGAGFKNGEVEMVLKQLERRFNTPQTTSTGRVLDAAAALLGACHSRTYEGEPAMKLEALASLGEPRLDLPIEIKKIQGRPVLKTGKIIYEAAKLTGKHKKSDIAASIQKSLSEGLAHLAAQCADKEGIKNIGVSGGVAYNDAIIRHIRETVSKEEYEFFTQTKAPPGDGGISLGQVWNAETIKLD